mmetsp:Transcript_129302/g.253231  ORF Transcript_129302/g.253231 Transcript_129302/m.253231 type:complete len:247 (-) Transcript_129302:480-1220(-)
MRNVPLPVSFHSLSALLKLYSLHGTSCRISSVSFSLRRTFSGSKMGSPSSSPPSSFASATPPSAAGADVLVAPNPPKPPKPTVAPLPNPPKLLEEGAGAGTGAALPKENLLLKEDGGALEVMDLETSPKPLPNGADAGAAVIVAGGATGAAAGAAAAAKENPANGEALAAGAAAVVAAEAATGGAEALGAKENPANGLLPSELAGAAPNGRSGFGAPVVAGEGELFKALGVALLCEDPLYFSSMLL